MRAAAWVLGVALLSTPFFVDSVAPSAALADTASATPPAASTSAPPTSPAPAPAWSDAEGFPSVTSADPMWGARTAPVTLVVFSDMQCPFCTKLDGTFGDLQQKYGPQKIRIIFKHLPLPMHKDAKPAAIAAEAVFRLGGSQAFYDFVKLAMADRNNLTPANFDKFAQTAGVDPKKVTRSLVAIAEKKVDADLALAKEMGVDGTPTTFVNGTEVVGSQDVEKFSKQIDEELAKAAKLRGVPADKVYVKLSKQAKSKAQLEKQVEKQREKAKKRKP
ncbi:MAG: thioredoxin domain-containing protein [Polyangiaceae bacterium]|nr:thioredoxin domain-containing protein [Polyangiaceae bacterium]